MMKLRAAVRSTGQLLSFISKVRDEDNFSFLFPVEGLKQFDNLLLVTRGFEVIATELREDYRFASYSIADVGRVRESFAEIDHGRLLTFELEEFLKEDMVFADDRARLVVQRQIRAKDAVFPNIRTGSYARATDFYDRMDTINAIWEKLGRGKSLILQAPRRYGKSSLLQYIVDNPVRGWRTCFIDLEGAASPADFATAVLKAVLGKEEFDQTLPVHLSGRRLWSNSDSERLALIRQERKTIDADWGAYMEGLFACLVSSTGGVLLVLDEFPWLLEDMSSKEDGVHNVENLMTWFHTARQNAGRLSFILSGSEHLQTFLDSIGVHGQTEDLEIEHLSLFNMNVAREFVFLVLAGQGVVATPGEVDLILSLVGEPIPYFLQIFLDSILETCRRNQKMSRDDIEKTYYDELLGPTSKRHFESVERQLRRYADYGTGAREGAAAILDALSLRTDIEKGELEAIWTGVADGGLPFTIMLGMLGNDFYVEETGGMFSIRSKLLREWWARHHARMAAY
jgi:hypothetical protein